MKYLAKTEFLSSLCELYWASTCGSKEGVGILTEPGAQLCSLSHCSHHNFECLWFGLVIVHSAVFSHAKANRSAQAIA